MSVDRFRDLLHSLEAEFLALHQENAQLKKQLNLSTGGSSTDSKTKNQPGTDRHLLRSLQHKFANAASKRRRSKPAQTWKIDRTFMGHFDGIWDLSFCPWKKDVFASASADHLVRLWNSATGQSLGSFSVGTSSVNSVHFHPKLSLMVCAAGDGKLRMFRLRNRDFLPAEIPQYVQWQAAQSAMLAQKQGTASGAATTAAHAIHGRTHSNASASSASSSSPVEDDDDLKSENWLHFGPASYREQIRLSSSSLSPLAADIQMSQGRASRQPLRRQVESESDDEVSESSGSPSESSNSDVDSYIDDLEEEGGMDMYDEHEGDLSREQIVPSAHGDTYSSGLSIQGSVFPETLQVAADSVQRWINDTPSFFQAPLPSATASSSFSSNTSTAPSAGLTVDAHRKSASCVRWSPVSNGLFLSSGRDGSVAIWMLREGSDLPQQLAREEVGNGQIAFLHVEHHATQPLFSPAAADGKFRLYDLRKRGAATTVYGHAEATNCVMFFPNADHAVATASDDQSVKLWDIRALKQPLCAYHFSSALNRFDVSPSGHLAVATDRRRCTIVSPQGTVIAHLEDEQRGHVMPVMASRWTPDGSAVITAGFDGMCLHWSLD